MECVLLVDTVASLSQDWKDIYAHVLKDNLLNQINPKIFNFDGTAFKDLNSLNFSSGDLFYSDYKTALSHAQKHSQNIIIISNNRPLEAMQARVSLITRRKGIITQISSTTTDKHIGSILVYLDTATFPADKSHTELLQKLKSQASTQSQLNKIAADDVFYTGLLNWQGNSTATEKECVVHAKRLGMAQFVTDPASLYPATWPLKLCVTSTANANIEAVQKAAQNYNLPVAELVAVQSNIDLKQYGFQGFYSLIQAPTQRTRAYWIRW